MGEIAEGLASGAAADGERSLSPCGEGGKSAMPENAPLVS